MTRSLYFSNRKEYYRRKRISTALKQYHSNRRIIKEQYIPAPKGSRLRKQVVYNSSYRISVRAIVINGKQTHKDLEQAIEEFLESNPALQAIPFDTSGLEEERISNTEDKVFKDGIIYIEYNQRGKVTIT